MRALLQRVSSAGVDIRGERVAGIGRGLLILLGVYPGDGEAEAVWLARKALDLRIFPDDARPMNRNVVEVGGGLLVVSQFTLAADVSRGNRPGFSRAAGPEVAEPLYERFIAELSARHAPVAVGRFGADMQVSLVNDGPVTILLERGPT